MKDRHWSGTAGSNMPGLTTSLTKPVSPIPRNPDAAEIGVADAAAVAAATVAEVSVASAAAAAVAAESSVVVIEVAAVSNPAVATAAAGSIALAAVVGKYISAAAAGYPCRHVCRDLCCCPGLCHCCGLYAPRFSFPGCSEAEASCQGMSARPIWLLLKLLQSLLQFN